VHEAVNFAVPDIGGMVYLDRVDTDWPFRVQLPVGSRVPFHCTATGKTYLSSLPRRRRRAFVKTLELQALTTNTIRDPKQLLDEADRIAERGYAIDNEEFMHGLVALAVPVTDAKGGFLAAIAFHGPSMRLDIEQALAHLPLMREGAQRLRELLTGA
jgi:DNA-binding IclR family transcriptional regulator